MAWRSISDQAQVGVCVLTRQQLEAELVGLARSILAEAGVELVDLALRGSGGQQVLRLTVDRAGVPGIDLSDCQRVSQALSRRIDDTELMVDSYVLEVSSPGIDRPLRTEDDFRRCIGRRLLINARDTSGTPRAFRGELVWCDGGRLGLRGKPDEEWVIHLEGVVNAQQDVGA